jgi:hypothetical protein
MPCSSGVEVVASRGVRQLGPRAMKGERVMAAASMEGEHGASAASAEGERGASVANAAGSTPPAVRLQLPTSPAADPPGAAPGRLVPGAHRELAPLRQQQVRDADAGVGAHLITPSGTTAAFSPLSAPPSLDSSLPLHFCIHLFLLPLSQL